MKKYTYVPGSFIAAWLIWELIVRHAQAAVPADRQTCHVRRQRFRRRF